MRNEHDVSAYDLEDVVNEHPIPPLRGQARDSAESGSMRMLDPTTEIMMRTARAHERRQDAIVLSVLQDLLPEFDIDNLGALKGRLEIVTWVQGPWMDYILDGKTIARFWPAEFTRETTPQGYSMLNVNQRYQLMV